jgi:hypothetical protein
VTVDPGLVGVPKVVTEPSTAPADEKPRQVLVGTGMPASILLDAFGQWVYDAFGETAYHVGSSMYGKQWRDVDVRVMLDDADFDALFPGYQLYNQNDSKWALVNAAMSALAQQQTGLPVDFQFQRVTDANRKYNGARNPLMLGNHHSVQEQLKRRTDAGSEQ